MRWLKRRLDANSEPEGQANMAPQGTVKARPGGELVQGIGRTRCTIQACIPTQEKGWRADFAGGCRDRQGAGSGLAGVWIMVLGRAHRPLRSGRDALPGHCRCTHEGQPLLFCAYLPLSTHAHARTGLLDARSRFIDLLKQGRIDRPKPHLVDVVESWCAARMLVRTHRWWAAPPWRALLQLI